ncbi:MAG TPA: C40 family peptidase [Gemmatimonadales bacterium]|nr:C40 family peptidase [Gemmatimonadales bacterium]
MIQLRPLLVALMLGAVPAAARAQSAVGFQLGHFFQGDGWATYRFGFEQELLGPLGVELYGTHLRANSPTTDRLWGLGADLTLFRVGRRGVYTVAGVAGGAASGASQSTWGTLSAGAGIQFLPLGPLALAVEARWRRITPAARDGIELSGRLSINFGGGRKGGGTPPRSAPTSAAAGEPAASGAPGRASDAVPLASISAPVSLGDSVVATAATMMGTAYRLGGTGADGFDCSGLIQYAYEHHGIQLPRTSTEQARQGDEVPRKLDELRPGDILTFSSRGGPVTHVGLYVGEGRFIHSASRGVQLSLLSDSDPYGRWWWRRWVGARRIVPSAR